MSVGIAGLFVVAKQNRDEQVADTLAGGGEDHHISTAPPLDIGNTNKRKEQIGHAVAGGKQSGHLFVQTDGFDEYCREVVAGN